MKKIIILMLAVLLIFVFTACDSEKESANDNEVKAEDTASAETEEEAEEEKVPVPTEEYILYKETYTNSGNYAVYEYNEKGHVIRKTTNYVKGDPLIRNYEYTYNEDGSYSALTSDGIRKERLEYDAKGRLLSTTELGYDSSIHYVYDDEDRVIEIVNKKGDSVRSSTKNEYDVYGNLSKEISYDGNGEVLSSKEYEYDEKGREIRHHDYNSKGEKEYENALYKWEEELDSHGRVIREKKIDVERGGTAQHYFYEYDEKGGMYKKTDYTMKTEYEYRPYSSLVK